MRILKCSSVNKQQVFRTLYEDQQSGRTPDVELETLSMEDTYLSVRHRDDLRKKWLVEDDCRGVYEKVR
jgi:hypothetical protein